MRVWTSVRQATAVPKGAVAAMPDHEMVVGPRVVVDAVLAMVLVIEAQKAVVQKDGGGVQMGAVLRDETAKVADRPGPMARRDRRIQSGSSIASMKIKMAR